MGVNHPNLPKVNVPGLPKRVVFKKPKIDKLIDLRAKAPLPNEIKPEQKLKAIERPLAKQEITLTVEEQIPTKETIQTKEKKRTIIIRREPVKSEDIIVIKNEPHKTFDEKFLDNLHVRSQITKNEKTLHELKKPEIKPTIKTKSTKRKRRFNLSVLISLILSILLTAWSYKIIKDYLANALDGSLASFMFVAVSVMITIMMFVWFIIELFMGDEK